MNYTPNEPPRTLTAAEIEKILPHRYPFALVDKILDYTPGQWAIFPRFSGRLNAAA